MDMKGTIFVIMGVLIYLFIPSEWKIVIPMQYLSLLIASIGVYWVIINES